MAKLSDVAQIANVNISTASRALNGDKEISEKTRQRIISIAKEIGYVKKVRKKLRNKNSKIIGIIVPEVTSNYYTFIINHIHHNLMTENFESIISVSDFDIDNTKKILRFYDNTGVAGVICVMDECEGDISEEVKSQLSLMSIPVIFIASEKQKIPDYDTIWVDEVTAVQKVINHLINMGHSEIAFIGEHRIEPRKTTYELQLKARGISPNDALCFMGSERFEEGGYLRMKELLSKEKLPTAVFIGYDQMVIGAVKALREQGLKVPDDISIASFDNIGASPYILGGLTTIKNPINEMISIATKILMNKIKDSSFTIIQNVSLQPTLVERNSVEKIDS